MVIASLKSLLESGRILSIDPQAATQKETACA
jgi:hypothetical protein